MALSPFEIRLEILKLAKDTLNDRYWAEQNRLRVDYEDAKPLNPRLKFPEQEHITSQDIISFANELNYFVSDTKLI
jgi:hypothetical protein